MAIEIKGKELELLVHGQVVKVKKPSMGQQQAYSEALEGCKKDKEVYPLMIGYLESLGFPKELAITLNMDEFTEVCEVVAGSKKN